MMGEIKQRPFSDPNIQTVKIFYNGDGCYQFSIQHEGIFNIKNYGEIELEIKSVKLTRKKAKQATDSCPKSLHSFGK